MGNISEEKRDDAMWTGMMLYEYVEFQIKCRGIEIEDRDKFIIRGLEVADGSWLPLDKIVTYIELKRGESTFTFHMSIMREMKGPGNVFLQPMNFTKTYVRRG